MRFRRLRWERHCSRVLLYQLVVRLLINDKLPGELMAYRFYLSSDSSEKTNIEILKAGSHRNSIFQNSFGIRDVC